MPSSNVVANKQSRVDKQYASLKDLAAERRNKLNEVLKLYKLHYEIDDLEKWIAEKEVVAGAHELGQDFEQVTVSQPLLWIACCNVAPMAQVFLQTNIFRGWNFPQCYYQFLSSKKGSFQNNLLEQTYWYKSCVAVNLKFKMAAKMAAEIQWSYLSLMTL